MLKSLARLKIRIGPEEAAYTAEQTDEEDIAEFICKAQIENYIRELGSCMQQRLGCVRHKFFCVFNILDNFIESIYNKK